jgi:hypothetical protein
VNQTDFAGLWIKHGAFTLARAPSVPTPGPWVQSSEGVQNVNLVIRTLKSISSMPPVKRWRRSASRRLRPCRRGETREHGSTQIASDGSGIIRHNPPRPHRRR